jgi:hypothetical protein
MTVDPAGIAARAALVTAMATAHFLGAITGNAIIGGRDLTPGAFVLAAIT